MAGNCCGSGTENQASLNDPRWRLALWIALAVNAGMFIFEFAAGAAADSRALQADALDFFGDSASYAISLAVAGMALTWRARTAMLKGLTMLGFGLWVLVTAILAFINGTTPHAEMMGIVGAMALVANVGVALLLYRFRSGDANMRSVWICSRNDAIGNVAVMIAALGVFQTGSAYPDLAVAILLATLAISGGWQIVWQARSEMRSIGAEAKGAQD
jgi:Co/Zn/Cd efflux system component